MNKKKVIFIIILLIAVIITGTFSWLSYATKQASLTLTIGDINKVQIKLYPYQLTGSLNPVLTYTNEDYVQVTARNNGASPSKMILIYKINSIDNALIDDGVKYTITKSSSLDGTYTEYANGNFSTAANGKELNILEEAINAGATSYYRVYLWLDSSDANQSNMQGKTLNVELNARMPQFINEPVLDNEGMIPIVFDTTGPNTLTRTIRPTDNNWYDYDKKKWANAVLVKENSTKAYDLSDNGNHGTLSGATYVSGGLNFDGTDDSITLPNNIGVTLPATYSVKFSTRSTGNQIIFGDYQTKAALGLYSANKFIVSLNDNTYVYSTPEIFINTDYWVDVVYNSLNDIKLYLNGILMTKTSSVNYWNWSDTKSYIGKRIDGTYFNGVIKQFVVYDDIIDVSNLNAIHNHVSNDEPKLYYNFENNLRENLQNNDGISILDDDILAYFVWIPRYKYKIWTLSNSSVGQEHEIDVVFEDKNSISNGSTIGSYITHPAFWWDNDSDGVRDNGEELSGIWVGKFETTGDATTPTIKPNMLSLSNQLIEEQFNTSLKFSGGVSNSDGVTFSGSNVYGLSADTDSHMAKNTDWTAVTYLSHSKYGINAEMYASNSTDVYSGRSGGNKRDDISSSRPISLENEVVNNKNDLTYYLDNKPIVSFMAEEPSGSISGDRYGYYTWDGKNVYSSGEIGEYNLDRMVGYNASTTGNIYGIYDMAGGSYESVMGRVSQDFGSSPKAKYYNIYMSTNSFTACNGSLCFGHGFFETNNWYNDYSELSFPFEMYISRSGYFNSDCNPGIFYYGFFSANGGRTRTFREVLVNN